MKKALILPVLLILSCSQEMVTPNLQNDNTAPSIIGKWMDSKSTYIETTYEGPTIIDKDTTVLTGGAGYLQLNADSTYYTYVPDNSGSGIYRDTGLFVFNSNILTMTSITDGYTVKFDVKELTDISLKINYIDTVTIPNGTFVTKGYLEYKK